jgi:hypothetical protein
MKSIIFWDMMPCSPLKVNRRLGGTYRPIFIVEEISSAKTSKQAGGMEICSSKTSVETQRTTWRHIPEDDTLLKKYMLYVLYTRAL